MAELVRMEAEKLAVRPADVVIIGKSVDPLSETGLLKNASL
jgi:hypothetical protein